jgi:hypothetical protein
VFGLSEVLRSVFVFGRVAAADVATDLAKPQRDPGVTHFQTLLASVAVGSYLAYLVKV